MTELIVCGWEREYSFNRCLICRGPFIEEPDIVCPDCAERMKVEPERDGGRGKRREAKQ